MNTNSTPAPQSSSFYMYPVSEFECENLIKNLKNIRTDLNSMPDYIFKLLNRDIAHPLFSSITKSLSLGNYPNCFKTGRVITIFKSDYPTDPDNYHLIGTLLCISKLFEY